MAAFDPKPTYCNLHALTQGTSGETHARPIAEKGNSIYLALLTIYAVAGTEPFLQVNKN
jgi:hypothetical protein